MRLKNLVQVLVFSPQEINTKGEYVTNWVCKGIAYLNKQQNLNELDRNSAGEIDYEIIKLYTDIDQNISKGDGICFINEDIEEYVNNIKTIVSPDYIVNSLPIIGKSIVYSCKKNNGEQ